MKPTNNVSERPLRQAVWWRKTTFRTDSATDSQLLERLRTTIDYFRRQGRDLLDFLAQVIEAHRSTASLPRYCQLGCERLHNNFFGWFGSALFDEAGNVICPV